MKTSHLIAVRLAVKKRHKSTPDAIDKIIKQAEQIKESVKSRAVAA